MTAEIVCQICRDDNPHLDLLIDELNDQLERTTPSRDDACTIVECLSRVFETKHEPAVRESLLNLFGTLSGLNILNEEIAEIVVKYLHELPPACLLHAIPIIAESKRLDRTELIGAFLNSANLEVKDIAVKYLSGIQ